MTFCLFWPTGASCDKDAFFDPQILKKRDKPMSRLKEFVLEVGKIGEDTDSSEPKGISRIRNSKEYYEAVDKTRELMEGAGMTVTVDGVGNIHGYLKGKDPSKKILAVGSHLDTVLHGGIFDGNLGVMSAIECAYRLKEQGIRLEHDLEIFGFNFEESSSLGGTFGSRAILGLADTGTPNMVEAMKEYHLTEEQIRGSKIDGTKYKSYLELHIEQGGTLDREKLDIGIVTGIIGVCRYDIIANGISNHAGTTKMEYRKDALVAMSKLIVKINDLALAYGDNFVATVGMINVEPGAENVVPGRCKVTLEMRHMKKEMYENFIKEVMEYSKSIPDAEFDFIPLIEKSSVQSDARIMDLMEKACKDCNVKYIRMPSGAGHDANPMAHFMPMGMIFVPSKDGVSHSRFEWTDWEYVDKGADVLYHTILELDKES